MRRQASVKKNLPQDPHTPLVDVVSSLTPGVQYGQLQMKPCGVVVEGRVRKTLVCTFVFFVLASSLIAQQNSAAKRKSLVFTHVTDRRDRGPESARPHGDDLGRAHYRDW